MLERNKVTIRVPATSANLGCGFDVLGMALDIWQEVTVERASEFSMTVEGEGAELTPKNEKNLICIGAKRAFEHAGKPFPTLKYHIVSRIPFMRGLGSSSAALVAGILAGLVLSGTDAKVEGEEALLQMAAEIEGHPDNVAPAIYGGLQIGMHTGSRWFSHRIHMPASLQIVLFIPDEPKKGGTAEQRQLLKPEISRADAVFNMQRLAFLVSCLKESQWSHLKDAMEDRLHQPQRSMAMPHVFQLIAAANKAGAYGSYLSGAGPSVAAFCKYHRIELQEEAESIPDRVGRAMLASAKLCGVKGRVFVTSQSRIGAHIVAAEPPLTAGGLHRFAPFGTARL
eukprot:TRINITY_DN4489_c0_g1_i2.p1 TRINITY_DN4489_c0_g1~~TRINITY_DN4489_c0_g1_i2.p1  ORF type:complete len:340 (+),score=115.95 TRINITY_DN4489_c0_g1_i2:101-1120(+)